jgi:hypothetical protein
MQNIWNYFFFLFQVVPTVYTDINEHIILSNQVISFFFLRENIFMLMMHIIDIYYDFKHSLRCSNSLPQFSVTEHFRSGESGRMQALPGVFFFYDLSPIKVPSWFLDVLTFDTVLQIDNVRVAYFTHLLLLFFYVRFVCSPSVMVKFGFTGNHCIVVASHVFCSTWV